MADGVDQRGRLFPAQANGFARVALANIGREYPHHEPLLQTGADEEVLRPRIRHPAFYGSYDWHSCVEMHWVLVRLLRTASKDVPEDAVRAALDEHLDRRPLTVEAQFFARPEHRTSQRPYGWGWLLTLYHDAATWSDPDAQRWADNLRPLAEVFVGRFLDWLPKATYPIRHGVHGNSAFGLSRALPLARMLADRGRPELLHAVHDAATRWYAGDRDYPVDWEPSGCDFLSPALTEAELMAGLLEPADFAAWLDGFLPNLQADILLTPAVVSDPTDGQIAHLHGLNLSRAWCWRRLAENLPEGDARIPAILGASAAHRDAGLPHATGSDYAVEHWLASYAVLLLT